MMPSPFPDPSGVRAGHPGGGAAVPSARGSTSVKVLPSPGLLLSSTRPPCARTIFFASRLVFEEERRYQLLLHNETAHEIQRRRRFRGLNAIIVPVRVCEPAAGLVAAMRLGVGGHGAR